MQRPSVQDAEIDASLVSTGAIGGWGGVVVGLAHLAWEQPHYTLQQVSEMVAFADFNSGRW